MTILITGGTGMVGTALTKALVATGHRVRILTRDPSKSKASPGISYYAWNPAAQTMDTAAVEGADAIVHLAGANVAEGRWTDKRKKEIVDSRVQSGQLLVKTVKEASNNIKTIISASAIGWYGPDPQVPNPRPFREGDPPDAAFLGATCRQWEEAIETVTQLGKRLVIYRIGIVLSREGGAYTEFRKPLRFGLATVLGNGAQMISWIHIDDMVRLLIEALENDSLSGIYNAVADSPVSNRHLVKTIATIKGSFYITAPVPAAALKIALGEMSVEVLKSATVSNEKIRSAGFAVGYPTIDKAVAQLEGT
jgi:hypothetical protein